MMHLMHQSITNYGRVARATTTILPATRRLRLISLDQSGFSTATSCNQCHRLRSFSTDADRTLLNTATSSLTAPSSTNTLDDSTRNAPKSLSQAAPYPFQSFAEYSSFLDQLEQRIGYRFKRPILVLSLMFYSSYHRYLEFVGSGLLRYYSSYYLYACFPHYDEGYLTKIKDYLHMGLNRHDMTMSRLNGIDLTDLINRIETAQVRWHEKQQSNKASTPSSPSESSANQSQLHSSNSSSTIFDGPLSADNARRQFERLLQSTKPPQSKSTDAFIPHTAFPNDLLTPILGALYLDGGWPAADQFANRIIKPQLLLMQSVLQHDLPDLDLGGKNYKNILQTLVQKAYGVTPLLEIVKEEKFKWTIRAVIPPIQVRETVVFGTPTTPSPNPVNVNVDSSSNTAILQHLQQAKHVDRTQPIVFKSFTGPKKLAEQRAARFAVAQLQAAKLKTNPAAALSTDATTTSNENEAETPLTSSPHPLVYQPHQLRSVISKVSAALKTGDLTAEARQLLEQEMLDVVQSLMAAKSVIGPGSITPPPSHQPTSIPADDDSNELTLDASPVVSADPFQLIAEELDAILSPPSSSTTVAQQSNLHAPFDRSTPWTMNDYHLLLDTLHQLRLWSTFPNVWTFLSDLIAPPKSTSTSPSSTPYLLTEATVNLLLDGLAHAHTLPLIVQVFRCVRHQQQWPITSEMYLRLLVSITRANPLWAWQQITKLLDELHAAPHVSTKVVLKKERWNESHPEAVDTHTKTSSNSTHLNPTIRHYNAGLYGFVCSYDSVIHQLVTEPNSPILISPMVILKLSDRARSQMRQRVQSLPSMTSFDSTHPNDLMTIGLLCILDAYAYRHANAWRLIHELERRLHLPPQFSPEREAWLLSQHQAYARGELSESDLIHPTQPMDIWTVRRVEFVRKHVLDYAQQAKPIIQTVVRILTLAQQQLAAAAATPSLSLATASKEDGLTISVDDLIRRFQPPSITVPSEVPDAVPAARLVGIEPNPGPLATKRSPVIAAHLIDTSSNKRPRHGLVPNSTCAPEVRDDTIEDENSDRVDHDQDAAANDDMKEMDEEAKDGLTRLVGVAAPISHINVSPSNRTTDHADDVLSYSTNNVTTIVPGRLLKDMIHSVVSFLDDHDWIASMQICHHWHACGATLPSRSMPLTIINKGVVPPIPPQRFIHHFTKINRPNSNRERYAGELALTPTLLSTLLPQLPYLTAIRCDLRNSHPVDETVITWPSRLQSLDMDLMLVWVHTKVISSIFTCHTLTSLTLTDISGEEDMSVFQSLPLLIHLVTLRLTIDVEVTDRAAVDRLAATKLNRLPPHLKYFNFCDGHKHFFPLTTLGQLQPALELEEFDLSQCEIERGDLELIHRFAPHLKRIEISPHHPSIFMSLKLFHSLEHVHILTLREEMFQESDLIDSLCAVPQLTSIHLQYWTPTKPSSWLQLSHGLTHLTSFIFTNIDYQESPPPFERLLTFHSLTSLTFNETECMQEIIDFFQSREVMPNLQRIAIDDDNEDEPPKFLWIAGQTRLDHFRSKQSTNAAATTPYPPSVSEVPGTVPAARLVGIELNPGPRSHSLSGWV